MQSQNIQGEKGPHFDLYHKRLLTVILLIGAMDQLQPAYCLMWTCTWLKKEKRKPDLVPSKRQLKKNHDFTSQNEDLAFSIMCSNHWL